MAETLHIITGTTAVGKTEYALTYAEEHNAEIISCDASLFYRGMDIGTAKPTAEEQARVPHHMIDICEVREHYDIVSYVKDARAVVGNIVSRGKSVLVTGGSGFYLKSFLAPVTDTVEVPNALRAKVDALFQDKGLEGLLEELYRLNPDGVEHLDMKNPRRVMRALERCLASGKQLGELQADFAGRPGPYPEFTKRLVLLQREKADLNQRIESRVEAMLAAGLVDEVRGLREKGIGENPSAASAIGYRETLAHLDGEMDSGALGPAIIQNTIRLAKKQRTWFRTQITGPDLRIQL